MVLTTGCDQWDRGLDVVAEGLSVRVTDQDMLRPLAGAWAAKWNGRWQLAVREAGFCNRNVNDHPSPGR